MKKFIFMITLLMGMVMSINAQKSLVDNGTVKDNWYIGVGVGTNVWNDGNSWTLFNAKSNVVDGKTNSWWRTQPLHVNVTVGKMFNPYLGVEADYVMIYNLRGQSKFLDAHNLTGNVVLNLNNIINGYDGKRDFCEVELLGGAGWYHNFNTDANKNAMTIRGAIRANLNVSKSFAITITPEYIWTPKKFVDGNTSLQGVNLSVGLKYRIPSQRSNFSLKALRDQSEIDALNTTINTLQTENENLAKANADLSEVIKKLVENGDSVKVNTTSIGSVLFAKGKSDVDASTIANVVSSLKATSGSNVLTGTTSPEGKEKFNKTLATKRAEAVKKALIDGGIDASRITVENDYAKQRSVTISVK